MPTKPIPNPLGRRGVLGIEKNTLRFGKNWDKPRLNSLITLVPNMLLKISGDLEFGGDYSH
jgi:hypothetical protein